MPLTLITGPANAAKAGAVLERLRAAAPRDPLLVVPTAADVEHYQRELAASGIVFGAEVLTFSRLVREIGGRAGLEVRPLGHVAADRVVRAAIADVGLRALARSAATPGFAGAAGALFAELQRSLVTPARFTSALRAWAGGSGRAAYASELGALYSAYRRRLERLGRPDREGYAWAALDALRAAPNTWGGRPVFFYGFDDLTPIQRDAVETLVTHAGADVLVALPYEPGRVAFAGRAATVEELRPLAEVVPLPERSEYYAASARPALHHLERSLFEPDPLPRPPNGAVRLLEAGGERAEAELVGAAVLELMRQGLEPPEIAVLLRGDAGTTALFAQVLAGYGIPVSHDRRVPLARTRLGAGVLAGARAALPGGEAADLLTWLRTPGRLADATLADALEVRVRRGELRSARAARSAWESRLGGPPLTALDTLAAAAAEGAEPLLRALEAEADAIWTAPHERRAEVLAAEDLADARVASDLRAAAAELRGLGAADAELLGSPQDILEALGAVEVREPSSIAGAAARHARRGRLRRRERPSGGRGWGRGARGRPAGRPARDPGAALPGGLRLRAPGRGVPAPAGAGAVPVRRGPARADGGRRPAAAAARGRARPRAVVVLRGGLAARGRAVPLLALVGRGGRAARAVRLPRRRPLALHRRAVGGARHAPARRRHLGAARRSHAARAAARLRRRRGRRRAGAARRPRHARGARSARGARGRAGARARVVRRLRRALAGRAPAASGPHRARSRADAARRARARRARADARAAARAHGLRADRAGAARRRARGAARRAGRARAGRERRRGRAAVRCCAAWKPTSSATCARRPSAAPATSRRSWSGRSAVPTTRTARWRWAAREGS